MMDKVYIKGKKTCYDFLCQKENQVKPHLAMDDGSRFTPTSKKPNLF
jgi:hypothetical protein